jgi:hypothetical protein
MAVSPLLGRVGKLLTSPSEGDQKYKTQLAEVWLRREVPARIREYLNFPETDEGIDLIAETKSAMFKQ